MSKTFRYTYKVVLQNGTLAGKCYYGQHTTKNLYDGYRGSGNIVRNYYKKYPERSSSIVYIQKFYNTKEELNQAEKELIEPHLGKDYCLNMAEGGHGGNLGEDVNKKISATQKGRKVTEETRAKISAAIKGKCAGDKNPMYGKRHTKEARKKMSASLKGKKLIEETRAKMSAAHKGDKNSRAKSITILNIITNEILTFSCVKDCAEYLQVDVRGAFRTKFLKGIPTPNHPILKNWKIIK